VPAIEEDARGCKVLYIVAQPQLSRIPFAALSFRRSFRLCAPSSDWYRRLICFDGTET
jgi:hypothetical protein